MPSWKLKAALQGTMSKLPRSHIWNLFFQKYVTRTLKLSDEMFYGKIRKAASHWKHYQQHHGPSIPADATVLEIGTGWYPVVPVALYLLGAGDVHTYDITPLMDTDRALEVCQRILTAADDGTLEQNGLTVLPERMANFRQLMNPVVSNPENRQGLSPSGILGQFNIHVHIQDVLQTGREDGAFHLFVSNNTFEHIPREALAAILKEYLRLCHPEGIMSHHIDPGDHYSYFDKSLTPLHFLQFSEQQYRRYNNDLQYQNRLRGSDFIKLFSEAGFSVLDDRRGLAPVSDLDELTLAPQFSAYEPDDLRVIDMWVVAKPADSLQAASSI